MGIWRRVYDVYLRLKGHTGTIKVVQLFQEMRPIKVGKVVPSFCEMRLMMFGDDWAG